MSVLHFRTYMLMQTKQEDQLPQRDRAVLLSRNISLSHSRSLKVTENDSIRKLGYGFLFTSHSNSEIKQNIGRFFVTSLDSRPS